MMPTSLNERLAERALERAIGLTVAHHRDYGDDELIDTLSRAVAGGHSDAEHLAEFADELHARRHQSTGMIAKAVANAAKVHG